MSSEQWYAALDGEQAGPFSRSDMDRMTAEGRIEAATLVWTAGMGDWTPAAETSLFGADPPPRQQQDGPAAGAAPGWGSHDDRDDVDRGTTSVPNVSAPAAWAHEQPGDGGEWGSASKTGAVAPDAPEALRGVRFTQAVARYFQRYAVFRGRASRAEFWWAMLFVAVGSIGLTLVDAATLGAGPGDPAILSSIFALATLLPTLAIAVRRLHDIGRSGWWVLIAFVPVVGFIALFVFHLLPGTDGDNRFGPTRAAREHPA